MLSNFQLDSRPLLQSFLVGQPQFRNILSSPDLEQLRQRVTASCHLGPMTESETKEYVEHRLRQVGWTGKPSFSADAHAAIYRDAEGVPRRINRLCSRVLLACCLDQLTAVDGRLVTQTAQDLARELGAPVDAPLAPAPVTPAPAVGPAQSPHPLVPVNGAGTPSEVNGALVEQRLTQAEARLDQIETVTDRLLQVARGLIEKLRASPN